MTNIREKTSPKAFYLLAACSFLLPMAIYLSAVCPTIHLGDSGELATAAAGLAIAHVPGYPLTTQFAHAITRLPLGSVAFRGNLFSVLSGSLACLTIFFLIRRVSKNNLVAFAVAAAFAGGQMFMEQSLKIRAYPLNTAFTAALIYLTLLWRDTDDRRFLYLSAFVFGLGMTNHQVLLASAMFPGIIVFSQFRRLKVADWLICSTLFFVGLTGYLYLPLRAAADPILNWGDPSTWENFSNALLQKQYAHKMLGSDWSMKLRMAGIILRSLITQSGVWVFAAALVGVVSLAKKDRVILIALAGVVVANIAIRVNYIGKAEFHQVLRYTISSTLMVAIAAGIGLSIISRRVRPAIMLPVLALTALWPFLRYYDRDDLSRHTVGEDFAKSSLSYPEQAYALAATGDNNVFPLWYYQRVERYREDVVLLPKAGIAEEWILDEIRPRLPQDATNIREAYAKVPYPIFYSTLRNLIASDYPVYSLFNAGDHPVENQIFDQWAAEGLIAPCGLGFILGGKACDNEIWDRLPMSSYIEDSIYRDFHTRSLLDNVEFHLIHRAESLRQVKMHDRADAALRQAMRVMPDDPRPPSMLYYWLTQRKLADQAGEMAQYLRGKFPGDPRVKALLTADEEDLY